MRSRVAALREMGFRIAVDDLGAGYAGLTSFAQLEPEVVKLDMSLVRDVHISSTKQKVIRSMTSLCRDMGMLVVAEGVETCDERDTLVELGLRSVSGLPLRQARPRLSSGQLVRRMARPPIRTLPPGHYRMAMTSGEQPQSGLQPALTRTDTPVIRDGNADAVTRPEIRPCLRRVPRRSSRRPKWRPRLRYSIPPDWPQTRPEMPAVAPLGQDAARSPPLPACGRRAAVPAAERRMGRGHGHPAPVRSRRPASNRGGQGPGGAGSDRRRPRRRGVQHRRCRCHHRPPRR